MAVEHLIRFDHDKAVRFRDAYRKAKADGQDQFSFEGGDFLTSYAKYVLEYLRSKGILQ